MSKFKPYREDQAVLFPSSINDYVQEEHLARIIDRIVEELDTEEIEKKYSDQGQRTYHPKIIIKLLFYGYAEGERSGRVLARKTETDVAYMYLSHMYKPNFRTINDFRKNHHEELSGYFMDIVKICKNMGMLRIGQINIDGTKIKANASNNKSKDEEGYKKWLGRIDKEINKILKECEDADRREDQEYGEDKRGDELPEEIKTQEKLKKKIIEAVKTLKDEKEKINLTDKDAKLMKDGRGRINVSYNCQAAVSENHFIVAAEVTNNATDFSSLKGMIETTEENLEEEINEIAADSGYASYENYEYLEERKKTGYIPDRDFRRVKKRELPRYHQENFTFNKMHDVYTCPNGKILSRKKYVQERPKRKSGSWDYRVIYEGQSCRGCNDRAVCTKLTNRRIARDKRQGMLDRMRKRLLSLQGHKKYLQRFHTVEPVFGNLKHNRNFRNFLLRGLKKVECEFKLMCIGHNLKKIHQAGLLIA